MLEYNYLEDLKKLESFKPFHQNLKKIKIENISEILKYLQFLTVKSKLMYSNFEINNKELKNVQKLMLKITLFEKNLRKSITNSEEKNLEIIRLYKIGLHIIATIYDFGSQILEDFEYSVRSVVLYSISEYESNSDVLITKLIENNSQLRILFEFNFQTIDNFIHQDEDILVLLILLFFSRKFVDLHNIIQRNINYFSKYFKFTVWYEFLSDLLNYAYNGDLTNDFRSKLKKLLTTNYKYDNPILFWFRNYLYESLEDFLNNSIWNLIEKIPNFPKKYIRSLIENDYFIFWSSQRNFLKDLGQFEKNCFILMETSAGKTLLAEIQSIFHIVNKKKVIYVCPTNALVNQVYNDFIIRFSKNQLNILRLSGNYENIHDLNLKLLESSHLVIITPEKLDFFIRTQGISFLNMFSLIILDEFQLIEDESRGIKYEMLIARIKKMIDIFELRIQFTLLSACIKNTNISTLLDWFGGNRKVNLVCSDWSPTRIIESIFFSIPDNDTQFLLNLPNLKPNFKYIKFDKRRKLKSNFEKILFLLCYLENYFPNMIFINNKPNCEQLIENIYNIREELGLITVNFDNYKDIINRITHELGSNHKILKYINYGLAYHHSSLPPNIKEDLEILARKGLIKIIVCTTTLAEGINFPTKSIIFHSLYCYNDRNQRSEMISSRKYRNIIGRTGRALKCSEGLVILFENQKKNSNDQIAYNFLTEDLTPISSYFSKVSLDILKNLISNKSFEDLDSFVSDLQVSLLANEDFRKMSPEDFIGHSLYGYSSKDHERFNLLATHIKKQNIFIKNFKNPMESSTIFNNSGFNLIFCEKLYSKLVEIKKINDLQKSKTHFCKTKFFKTMNLWIYSNHFAFKKFDQFDKELVNIWIFNGKYINNPPIEKRTMVSKISSNFDKIYLISTYLPWIWSLIIKILLQWDESLQKELKFVPFFIKFGISSREDLVNILYKQNEHFYLDNEKISKDKINKILS